MTKFPFIDKKCAFEICYWFSLISYNSYKIFCFSVHFVLSGCLPSFCKTKSFLNNLQCCNFPYRNDSRTISIEIRSESLWETRTERSGKNLHFATFFATKLRSWESRLVGWVPFCFCLISAALHFRSILWPKERVTRDTTQSSVDKWNDMKGFSIKQRIHFLKKIRKLNFEEL